MYRIIWDPRAQDALDKLEFNISRRIIKNVEEMKESPFKKDVKKLNGSHLFRLRVGDYRVVFEIESDALNVLKIGHRQQIYD